MRARLSLLAGALALAGCATIEAQLAPAAEPLSRWERHSANSARAVDHRMWAAFLARYRVPGADGVARVRYAAVTAADREALKRYVAQLEAVEVDTLNRREQLAYWVNLYNAVTVRTVLDRYPVKSIRDISLGGGLFQVGPWGAKLVTVKGERLSLDDIEHRILRPLWRDPRIHYVVNCASLGCPHLPAAPLTGANAEAALEAAARAYINHPRGATLQNGRLVVSRIYRWYREDFGESEAAVIAHIRRYALPPLAAQLAGISAVDRYEYDWSLNDAAP
jgi:Protein of unknown function, DUF547